MGSTPWHPARTHARICESLASHRQRDPRQIYPRLPLLAIPTPTPADGRMSHHPIPRPSSQPTPQPTKTQTEASGKALCMPSTAHQCGRVPIGSNVKHPDQPYPLALPSWPCPACPLGLVLRSWPRPWRALLSRRQESKDGGYHS